MYALEGWRGGGRGHGDVHSASVSVVLWLPQCTGFCRTSWKPLESRNSTTVSDNEGTSTWKFPQPSPYSQAAGVVVIPYDKIPNQALPLIHFVLLDGKAIKAIIVPDDCSVPQCHNSAKVDHLSVLLRLLQFVFNSLFLKSSGCYHQYDTI